jgi:hypothetical protein
MLYSNITRLWGSVNYKPDIGHFDNMFLAAKEVSHSFEHWWTDKINIILHDFNKRESLTITSKQVGFETIQPDNIKNIIDTYSKDIKALVQKLNNKEVTRFGLRVTAYMDLGLKFEEYKERLRPMCLPYHERLETLTSSRILDLALNFDYDLKDKMVMLRIGPMKKKQGLEHLQIIGDIKRLFPIDEESGINKIYTSIPNEFLFFDLDVFREDRPKIDDLDVFFNDAWSHIESVQKGIKDIILEL